LKYRSEIDGLRAVAVLPVLAYHAGLGIFPGGFFGVDIFFVISGYLITSILAAELASDRYSLLNFYERRARRILPALLSMVLITTLAASILLGPEALQSYSQSVVSVVAFASNVYFYLTSGYFATAAEELPLLHTWSLAVEEQYYLFFPILMWLLWANRTRLITTLVALSLLSFVASLWLTTADASANFYLIISRAWELFAGSFIALYFSHMTGFSKKAKETLSWCGLILIAVSLVFLTKHAAHPGWPTLIPVIGTCLIIGFAQHTSVGTLLSNRFFIWVGLISYSLYLWHQPIYAFIRVKSLHEPNMWLMASGTALAFLLAWISYHWVEKPFRDKSYLSQKRIFGYSGAALSAFLVFGILGHTANGWINRYNVELDLTSIQHSPMRYQCHASYHTPLDADQACTFGQSNPNWAVFGDSHGVELSFALADQLKLINQGVSQHTYSGCPPAFTFSTPAKGCAEFVKDRVQYLSENESIQNVIIAFRHTAHISTGKGQEKAADNALPKKILLDPKNATLESAREIYKHSMESIISSLQHAGKNVYLLYPIPELPTDINKLIIPTTIFDSQAPLENTQYPIDSFYQRNIASIKMLDTLRDSFELAAIYPSKVLCDNNYCYAVKNNQAMYFDDNHLSNAGAKLVVDSLLKNQ
jgi:peptidoglycan/LPS O-acetylase OafA/YrhL